MKKSRDKGELLLLQKEYRAGRTTEQDLTEEQIIELKELYKTQIKFLEESIEKDKKEIIKIREKLSAN